MSASPLEVWEREIRDYLLGRVSAASQAVSLRGVRESELAIAPVRRWWTFEGKHYPSLGGTLAVNGQAAMGMARRLHATFNPRLRISDQAEGVVDWGLTLARGRTRGRTEYVVHSASVGLSDAEHATLLGWQAWISAEWTEYAYVVKLDPVAWGAPPVLADEGFTPEQLRRWAHTARRSRWPLLHDVVAESLRPVLEPEELDRIPLPSDPAKLFELLCLVRIARRLAPLPRELRWLGSSGAGNVVPLLGVTCHHQQHLDRDGVLACTEYAGPLARAIDTFGVGIHQWVDLAFDFEAPRSGFGGIIVEAKSGAQRYEDAVAQLRTYRAARPRRAGTRFVIWAIAENPVQPATTADQVARALADARGADDVWVFSSAEDIDVVLAAIFGDHAR